MIAQTIILSVISSILLSSAVHADDPCRYEVSGKGVIDLTSVGRSDGEPAYKNLAPLVESNYSRLFLFYLIYEVFNHSF